MAWIRTISEDEATGDLERQYKAAVKRAGKVFQIVKLQSLRPEIMRTFMELYVKIMHGASSAGHPGGLTRTEREMVATVVSKVNHCHYWTEAHGEDLRQVSEDDQLVERVKKDPTTAELTPRQRAIVDFAIKLTVAPKDARREDLDPLRAHGLADEDIFMLVHVIGYFNHINRVADGLGIDLEPGMPASPY